MEDGELCVMILLATSMPESLATVLVLGEVSVFLNIIACLLSVHVDCFVCTCDIVTQVLLSHITIE